MATMVPVKSSNLRAIGFDAETRALTVEFASGGKHVYADVPPELHDELMKAESVGKFFHQNIRNAFTSSRVEEEESDQS